MEAATDLYHLLINAVHRTFTFWRFALAVPLAAHEMAVRYAVNGGQQIEFWVPGRGDNMRWAAHSVSLLLLTSSLPH